MYADLVRLQSQLQGSTMAFNNMVGQMTSQRLGLPMSSYNPYATAMNQQYLSSIYQAQNRLMGLGTQRTPPTNATNASSNQVIDLCRYDVMFNSFFL